MKATQSKYAVVTGASRGLGKAFALELAKRKFNVILVSLPEEGLEETALEIEKAGCKVAIYETDLTEKQHILDFCLWVNDHFQLEILINNAGFGGDCPFLEAGVDYIDYIIQINVRATALITRLLLPNLLRNPKSYVLNVSSMAAFSPIAYKTVYPASKAFVQNFTLGLQREFADTNITFSVVNPGPIKTPEEATDFFERIMALPSEAVSRRSIKNLFRGKKLIKLDWVQRLGLLLLRSFPVSIKSGILSNIFKRRV